MLQNAYSGGKYTSGISNRGLEYKHLATHSKSWMMHARWEHGRYSIQGGKVTDISIGEVRNNINSPD